MNTEEIEGHCVKFKLHLQEGKPLTAAEYITSQKLPTDVQLLTALQKLARELQQERHAKAKHNNPEPRDDAYGPTAALPSNGWVTTSVGDYKLLQKLGEGGMGTVYLAEQLRPVRRRVALKVIKPGMDTQHVIARFEAERQALALMDHPNIARVLDAGTTSEGRPYFVMELVKGIPITQFCDEKQLTARQRLELFLPVCHAVQHAHHKGIMHRDLKPTNILVAEFDDRPAVKIIDFGLAKAVSQQLTQQTLITEIGQIVGTIDYMSPEQASFNQFDIDTRTDIYSLGVLLYELLTGETPFDRKRLKQAAFDEVLRIIREEDPPRPSLRISRYDNSSKVGANRRTESKKLTHIVQGELDWIVMKAMEKDRSRRYETANGLCLDVQRYLNDEEVTACPPSMNYRLRKLVHRNKAAFAMGTAIFVALIFGLLGTSWQASRAVLAERLAQSRYVNEQAEKGRAVRAEADALKEAARANSEAENAKREAQITHEINDFVNSDLLGQANPWMEEYTNKDITMRQVLDRAAKNIESRFDQQPLVKAAIYQTLASTYIGLGAYDLGANYSRKSLTIRSEKLGTDSPESLESESTLADALKRKGRSREAEVIYRRMLKSIENSTLPNAVDWTIIFHNGLATSLHRRGDLRPAIIEYRKALELTEKRAGLESSKAAVYMSNLAIALGESGHTREASQFHSRALALHEQFTGKQHPDTAGCMMWYSMTLLGAERYSEAAELQRRADAIFEEKLGPTHYYTVLNLWSLLRTSRELGRDADAAEAFRKMVAGSGDPTVVSMRAGFLASLGRWSQAKSEFLSVTSIPDIEKEEQSGIGPSAIMQLATLLLVTGDRDLHRTYVRKLADKWKKADPAHVVWLLTMSPDTEVSPNELSDLSRQCLTDHDWAWTRFLTATADYRRGDYTLALANFQKSGIGGEYARYSEFWNAMIQHKLGNREAARLSLRGAEEEYKELLSRCFQSLTMADAHNAQWWFVAYTQTVRREAWGLIEGGEPPDDDWEPSVEAIVMGTQWAHTEFERLAEAHPETGSLCFERLTEIFIGGRNWEAARQALFRAETLSSGHKPQSQTLLDAKLASALGETARAQSLLTEYLNSRGAGELPNSLCEWIVANDDLCQATLTHRPNDATLLMMAASHSARHGKWQASANAYESLMKLMPDNDTPWFMAAVLYLQLGKVEDYRRICEEMLVRFGNPSASRPDQCERVAKTCFLMPDAIEDLSVPRNLANYAFTSSDDKFVKKWARLAEAMGDFRANNFEVARSHALECQTPDEEPIYLNAISMLIDGMALYKLDRKTEAQDSLSRAFVLAKSVPDLEDGPIHIDLWHERLRFLTLQREAEKLVGVLKETEHVVE